MQMSEDVAAVLGKQVGFPFPRSASGYSLEHGYKIIVVMISAEIGYLRKGQITSLQQELLGLVDAKLPDMFRYAAAVQLF